MNNLIKLLKNKKSGIVMYGFTPPKRKNSTEKIKEISERRTKRLKKIDIDGLVIYDIQDEADRTGAERPFPFLDTVDPIEYYDKYLPEINTPPIIYQCVGKYSNNDLSERLENLKEYASVFVGASSGTENVKTSLKEAYNLYSNRTQPLLGGVIIAERHVTKGDEHLRMVRKQKSGCNFFISQFVFDIDKIKNVLSDYYYYCKDNSIDMVPIIFTLTPCGSVKTVELLNWLGVDIPKWVVNDLNHSEDTLNMSMELCKVIVKEMVLFCGSKNIPFGFNIESVSIKKEEVLASFDLVNIINKELENSGLR